MRWVTGADEFGVTIALVTLVLVVGLTHPNFFNTSNLLSVLQSASLVAIVAYGTVFLLAQREIDLSVGGVFAVSMLVAGVLMGHGMNPWLGLVVAPVTGMALSAVTAVVSNLFAIPVIIVSIGTLSLYGGLATVITSGQPLQNLPVHSSFFTRFGADLAGVPMSVLAALAVGVVLALTFSRTRFGVHVRSVGSNPDAARMSGISPERIKLLALMLSGALCGLAAMLDLAYLQNANASVGNGFELQVIAAAIIGGTAVSGGTGTVIGALLGASVVGVIASGLVYFSINPNWNDVVSGAVVLLAVSGDGLIRRRRRARQTRVAT